MILLDTNVVSEPARPNPDANVLAWYQRFRPLLALQTVTIAELRFGCAMLPAGARRTRTTDYCDRLLRDFAGRIYAFDVAAANRYGEVCEASRAAGRPMDVPDAQIAAIALALGCEFATRNTADFAHLPLKLINPWTA